MTRAIGVYGALLVALLGLSWAEWTKEPEADVGDKVVVSQGQADEIESIKFSSEKDELVFERKSDAKGAYYWVTHTRWEKAAGPAEPPTPEAAPEATPEATAEATPADAAATPAATPAEAPKAEEPRVAKTQIFKSGDAGQKLVESLSPMLALRKLDGVSPEKLATIGLDAPKEKLEITRKGRTRSFELGGEAYGSKDRYARDVESGEIYLIDDETIRPLKYATTRLPDRTLLSVERKDIATATIAAGTATLDVASKNTDDEAKATWVKASAPDEANDQLKTWMDKALQLKGTSYAKPDDTPQNLEPRFQLTLQNTKGERETLEVLQAGADGDWYGRSEHTRGLIKLLRGPTSALGEDVDDLVGG